MHKREHGPATLSLDATLLDAWMWISFRVLLPQATSPNLPLTLSVRSSILDQAVAPVGLDYNDLKESKRLDFLFIVLGE